MLAAPVVRRPRLPQPPPGRFVCFGLRGDLSPLVILIILNLCICFEWLALFHTCALPDAGSQTLVWTMPQMMGVPPPLGLGAACLSDVGKVLRPCWASRSSGRPACWGYWAWPSGLRVGFSPPHLSLTHLSLTFSRSRFISCSLALWSGHCGDQGQRGPARHQGRAPRGAATGYGCLAPAARAERPRGWDPTHAPRHAQLTCPCHWLGKLRVCDVVFLAAKLLTHSKWRANVAGPESSG